jgi:hypothetical protein
MDSNDEPEREANPPSAAEELAPQTTDVANREATELRIYQSAASNTSRSTKSQYQGRFGSFRKFWREQVSLTVPHVKCRDHLGMLTTSHLALSPTSTSLMAALQQMSAHS